MPGLSALRLSLIAILLCASSQARAQDVADAFRGKTVRILIPTGPGGDRGLYATAFASFFGRHIPGTPNVTPVFMPGAGGSVALNNLYSIAAPDGLTLATPLTSVLSAQATGETSVAYDARKFTWIGRISDTTRVHIVSGKLDVKTLDDLRRTEIIVGAVGQASETYSNPAFMNRVFGTKYKIVNGYGAAAKMKLAMESGETQGAYTTWNDVRSYHSDWIRDGKVKVLLQIALTKHPDLPEVPLLLDMARNDEERQLVALMSSASQMGQSYAAPPGLPADLTKALRDAFDATMADPAYVEKLKATNVDFNPVRGADLQQVVDKIMSTPKAILDRYKAAVASD